MVGCWKDFIKEIGRILLSSAKARISLLDEKTLLSLVRLVLLELELCLFGAEGKGDNAFYVIEKIQFD